jgi:SAM-dependent methyltransferase
MQGRLLSEYNYSIFPGQHWNIPNSSDVADFMRPFCAGDRVTLTGVLNGLSEVSQDRPVVWVDMGGGRALPMRQLATDSESQQKLRMINVDLFDFDLDGLDTEDLNAIEEITPGAICEQTKPRLIEADMETVKLPEVADVITSIETIQYLNDPLRAICNWYNQLSDNGFLMISTDHDWAGWIRYKQKPYNEEGYETPTKHFLAELNNKGLSFATTFEADYDNGFRPRLDPNKFRVLIIQRKPGSSLKVNSEVSKIWINPYNYKAVYYEEQKDNNPPIVEVVLAK